MKTQNTVFSLLLLFGFSLTGSAMEKSVENHIEVDSITYLEEEDTEALDFDTEAYLPEDFNAYAAPDNVLHVSYIENEQEVDLGFDPEKYLPGDFNPHKFFFYIHSIEYIEQNKEVNFDIDIQDYLPAKFDATIGR